MHMRTHHYKLWTDSCVLYHERVFISSFYLLQILSVHPFYVQLSNGLELKLKLNLEGVLFHDSTLAKYYLRFLKS